MSETRDVGVVSDDLFEEAFGLGLEVLGIALTEVERIGEHVIRLLDDSPGDAAVVAAIEEGDVGSFLRLPGPLGGIGLEFHVLGERHPGEPFGFVPFGRGHEPEQERIAAEGNEVREPEADPDGIRVV